MGRGYALGALVAVTTMIACSSMDNSWSGEESFSGDLDAWNLGYPSSDRSEAVTEINAAAYGFAMGEDRATVSMHDMTCGVQVDSGTVFFDLDLRTGEIQDGLDNLDGRTELTSVLVAPPLVTLVPVDRPMQGEQYLVRGIREARLLDPESFVALRVGDSGGCEVRWYEAGRLGDVVDMGDDVTCEGDLGFTVDRLTGDAWVATPSGVFAVRQGTVQDLGLPGDLLALDQSNGRLYVGSRGESTIQVVSDGQVSTFVELPGALVDFDDAGVPGGLVVAHADQLSHSVVRFDATGAELDHLSFEQPVLDVAVSDGGHLMAIARVDDHAYYRIK